MEPVETPLKETLARFGILLIVCGLMSYIIFNQYRIQLLSNQIDGLTMQNDAYTSELKKLEEERLSVAESFNNKYSTLSSEKKNLEDKVTTLDKITKSDPQLLKKYSKIYFLNENYQPSETQVIFSDYTIRKNQEYRAHVDVIYFLQNMINDARKEGLDLRVISAYRSFDTQVNLKAQNKVTYGANTANRFVAEQGYSEHQLGTALDLTTTQLADTSVTFERTPEYQWLIANAYKYGFILSYPKGNEYYAYEPWHWRFVGKALATRLRSDNVSFYDLDQRVIDEYLVNMFDK